MSRLSELIAELCPDGVEYKRFDEIGTIFRGKRFVKKDFVESSDAIPCIHYGEMYTYYGMSATQTRSFVRNAIASKLRYANPDDVIIVGAGETVEDIGHGVAWLGASDVAVHDACYVMHKHSLLPKYLSYYLLTHQYHRQIRPYISSAKISALSPEGLKQTRIPVPPIEVQREIVRILDSFQELDDALTAEIENRTRQFEHYRDALLGSRLTEYCPNGVDYKALGEVAPFVRERANTDEAQFDAYVGVDALLQNKEGRDLTKTDIPSGRHVYFRPGDTLVGNIRPYLKKIWYADCFGGTNGDVLVFRSTDSLETKYLYHVLASDVFFDYDNGHAKGSKMPRGDKGFIKDYRIPVPPIEVQREIVSMLDSFQSLIVVMSVERDARRKQFAYYRDKLLDFPEKVTTNG